MPGSRIWRNGTPPLSDPWELIRADELAISATDRADRGAWYTPRAVAERVVELAMGDAASVGGAPPFVVDPTCGGGAFLVAVLDRFAACGVSPSDALGRIGGMDIDSGAIATCRRVIEVWAEQHRLSDVGLLAERLVVGDALGPLPEAWPAPDIVVGNPPFASPLRASGDRASADLPAAAMAFRREHDDVLGPYADLAAIHLFSAARRLAPGGRIAMVVPQSLLAGRDAAALRGWFDERFPVESMWISAERHFDANVRVCAPVLAAGANAPSGATSWAEAAAGAMGVPAVDGCATSGTLGSMATATAGFRDEYYAVASACVEEGDGESRPRVATVGSIDPLESLWGREPIRFAKTRWHRPVVDVCALDGRWSAWLETQLRPKVLLPTQARILEPYVDRAGELVPVTPVISILPSSSDPEQLDRIAAVLLAPAVVAWSARRSFGSALSAGAMKLRAADVLDIPLPADADAWERAASLVPEGPEAVPRIAALMQEAYEAGPELLAWWSGRVPAR